MSEDKMVRQRMQINASKERIWNILTDPDYAKELGNEFDENAFMQSDWKLGSPVYFIYENDKIAATGNITELKKFEKIYIQYNEFSYVESFSIITEGANSIFEFYGGPYLYDHEEQVEVWNKWLLKLKSLSEEGI